MTEPKVIGLRYRNIGDLWECPQCHELLKVIEIKNHLCELEEKKRILCN